jgi:hypothetical protein
MTEFPTIVYRCPGAWFGPLGTTYTGVGVNNEAQLKERLAEGFFLTIEEAVMSFKRPKVEPEPPPTRGEMLEQAEKIGLKVDKRWNDATLLQNITEHMKETK